MVTVCPHSAWGAVGKGYGYRKERAPGEPLGIPETRIGSPRQQGGQSPEGRGRLGGVRALPLQQGRVGGWRVTSRCRSLVVENLQGQGQKVHITEQSGKPDFSGLFLQKSVFVSMASYAE
jgi:hypothetical protein